MPLFSEETVGAAKRIDLLTYFEFTAPDELVHDGAGAYKTRTHGSLSISNGKWFWHSKGIGGKSALDYLIKIEGFSFPDAMNRILGISIPSEQIQPVLEIQKPRTLALPYRHSNNDKAREYLLSRGIREDVFEPLMEQGLIYESRYRYANSHREAVNIVFIGKDENGTPKYAGIRGIGTNYKGEATGSDKRYSFSVTNTEYPGTALHVFESPIDLLSYASIMRHESCGHAIGHMLSLGGLGAFGKRELSYFPIALSHYLGTHSDITAISLKLDNDIPGRFATEQIKAALDGKYTVVDSPPKRGKDYNDYLRIKYSDKSEYVERKRCYER